MKISMRAKVIVAIVAVIIFCSLFFTVRLNIQGEELLRERQQFLTHASVGPIDRRIDEVQEQLELAAIQIMHNNDIINAFANQDRLRLAELIGPLMEQLAGKGIDVLHFHLPDATTLYRGHNPELYGDYLGFRNMVLDVIEYREVMSGFEYGISGLNYRIVVPVVVDNEYIGSFEVGKNFGEEVLGIWKRAGAGQWYIYEFEGGLLGDLVAQTCKELQLVLCEEELEQLANGEITECTKDNNMINMIPLRNYKGDINWVVIRIFDNSELIQMQIKQQINNIIFGMALAAVFGLISFMFLRCLASPFNELIRTTDLWAQGELHKPLIVKTGDEIERLANTMENMRVSLLIQRQELQKSNEELVVTNKKLTEMYDRHNQDIAKAAELHKRFLPNKLPIVSGTSVAAYYVPARMASGDFYNAIKYQDKLIVYLVDVSGHGIDGALMNIFIRNIIDQYIEQIKQQKKQFLPSEMLEFLVSKYFQEEFPEDYHFAIVVVEYDVRKQRITYVNAGNHILPFFCEKGNMHRLVGAGLPISSAIPKELLVYKDTVQEISCDDWVLLMSTDGIVEEELQGIQYGEERLVFLLQENYKAKAERLLDILVQDLRQYTSKDSYTDDVTLIVLSGGESSNRE